tara:strand:- start:2300 stop:2752 length:453 start_codon:yes stop_codon:yes gene_type:complete
LTIIQINGFFFQYINNFKKVHKSSFGTGVSQPTSDGYCPATLTYDKELELYNILTTQFYKHTMGDFFWNFKTESDDIHWNFLAFHDHFSQKSKEKQNLSFLQKHGNYFGFISAVLLLIIYLYLLIKHPRPNRKRNYNDIYHSINHGTHHV